MTNTNMSGPELTPIQNLTLPSTEAEYLMNNIFDICTLYESSRNLPGTLDIQKNPNYFLEKILQLLEQFNLITK